MPRTNPPARDLAQLFEFFNEIGILHQLSSTRFDRVLPDGLTLSQFSVLNHFVRLDGTRTPAQLASAFQVTKGAMTNTLKKLAAKRCIKITADPDDGRSKRVEITARGRAVREKARRAADVELADVARGLDIDAVRKLLPALQQMRSALDTARDAPGE